MKVVLILFPCYGISVIKRSRKHCSSQHYLMETLFVSTIIVETGTWHEGAGTWHYSLTSTLESKQFFEINGI